MDLFNHICLYIKYIINFFLGFIDIECVNCIFQKNKFYETSILSYSCDAML